MEGRDAHADGFGEALDVHGLVRVLADPFHRCPDLAEPRVSPSDLLQPCAPRALQQAVADLAFELSRQDGYVGRRVQQPEQAAE